MGSITFRLDELGDITWYNDLSHLTAATGPEDFEDISESADVLFSCEMYEVLPATQLHGPQLLFVANAGYSIEFKVRVGGLISPAKIVEYNIMVK